MKIARSIYEAELNILWLKDHPEEIRDFVDYNVIQQKQLFDRGGSCRRFEKRSDPPRKPIRVSAFRIGIRIASS
jgi:hypothetical protein